MKSQNMYQYNQNSQSHQSQGIESKDHLRKMFIGGLSAVTTEDSLRAFFGQWGEVVDAVVMRDPQTKRSRGFGFISYSDQSMVDKAQAARPHVIDGKTVDSKRALPRPEVGRSESNDAVKKIFVGGLKDSHDEIALTEHFSQFGNVVSVKILTDKTTGRKRGFAFVEFDDYDSVDKAVLHKSHTIKYVLVDVKKSVYKQELAKKLAAQQQQGGGMMMQPGAVPPPPSPYPQQVYSQQPAYPYPPQVPQQPGAYNGWAGYAQPAAPTAYPPPPATYGAYGAPQNGTAAAWNAAAYPAASWGQNGYTTPAAAPVAAAPVAAAPPAAAPPAQNTWNAAAAPQNFGDYQQAYNGGPQKAGSLQGNRMNPYSVAAAPSYGI